MKREIDVLKQKSDGAWVLHPKGTFRGHGGIIGIPPYRELATVATDEELGELVLNMLQISGPTGAAFAEFSEFKEHASDEQSRDVERRLYPKGTSTHSLAKRFQRVSIVENRRSWDIVRWRYDPSRKAEIREEEIRRVKHDSGAIELGRAIREASESCP